MKRLLAFASLASLTLAASAFAQEETELAQPAPVETAETRVIVRESQEERLPELNPSQVTPELYLYMQELRRHDDPKQAVRRKAEARTAAREARITAMKWYGMSNARPLANPRPVHGNLFPLLDRQPQRTLRLVRHRLAERDSASGPQLSVAAVKRPHTYKKPDCGGRIPGIQPP